MTNLHYVVAVALSNWINSAKVDLMPADVGAPLELPSTNLLATIDMNGRPHTVLIGFRIWQTTDIPVVIPPVVVVPPVVVLPPVVVVPPPVDPPVIPPVIPPVVVVPPLPPPLIPPVVPTGPWINTWFVAPNGNDSNTGLTPTSPRTLDWAFAAPPEIRPGHTIELLGGRYEGGSGDGQFRWVNRLAGTPDLPITVRNFNHQRATLHVWTNCTAILNVGRWNRIIGLEFTCDSPVGSNHQPNQNIAIRPGGYASRGFSNVLANCVFHKMGNSIGQNSPVSGTGTVYYGNSFFGNGWQYMNDGGSGSGYSMYVRNDQFGKGRPTLIKHNLFGDSFDFHVHSYGTGDRNADIHAIENAFFGAGSMSSNARTRGIWLTAAGGVTSNFVFQGNVFQTEYQNRHEAVIVKHGQVELAHGPNIYSTFTSNWFIGGTVNTWRAEREHTFTYNTMINRHGSFALIGGHGGPPPSARQNVTRNFNRYVSQRLASSVGLFTYRVNAAADPSYQYNLEGWRNTFGYDRDSTFEGVVNVISNVWVWPNEYEPQRAHVFIINSTLADTRAADTVTVDLGSIFPEGAVVKVRNIQNFYEPHATLTVRSGRITIPMTGLKTEPSTVLAQFSGNRPFAVPATSLNGSRGGFVVTTW